MHNRTMLSFHKDRDCPTSQELLAYKNGGTSKTNTRLDEHICSCDFCGAEMEFYDHFPSPADDLIAVSEIPDHLFQLAEALLNNKDKGNTLLKKLLSGSEMLAL